MDLTDCTVTIGYSAWSSSSGSVGTVYIIYITVLIGMFDIIIVIG